MAIPHRGTACRPSATGVATVGNLDIEVTFSDPGTYAKPWTAAVRAELAPDTEMIEWVCNEGRSGLEHWVGRASEERKRRGHRSRLKFCRSTSARMWSRQPYWRAAARIVQITVDNDRLVANMDGRGNVPLIATSDAAFTGLYGLGVKFIAGRRRRAVREARLGELPIRPQVRYRARERCRPRARISTDRSRSVRRRRIAGLRTAVVVSGFSRTRTGDRISFSGTTD